MIVLQQFGSGSQPIVEDSVMATRKKHPDSCFTVLVATWLLLVPLPVLGAEADFSVVTEVQDLGPLIAPYVFLVPGPAGALHHEISIPEGCPEDPPGVNGDGDGDGNVDDRQLDINGAAAGQSQDAPNGSLQLWCIDPDPGPPIHGYYALLYDPAGPAAGLRFIGKCPFEGGWNEGWKFINPRTAHIQEIKWESKDHALDDDADGKADQWVFDYDTGADTVEQRHFENGALQGDGAAAGPPPERPFVFPDLLPKNPTNDNPTIGLGNGGGGMFGELPRVLAGIVATLELRTVIANDGPMSPSDAAVTLTVEAPERCTVDGGGVATRSYVRSVGMAGLEEVFDQFSVECDTPGARVFTITTEVVPAQAGVTDPVSEDDVTIATLTVDVASILEVPTLSRQALAAMTLLLLLAAWILIRRGRPVEERVDR